MTEPDVRKGMPPVKLSRQEFESRYKSRFVDPIFASLKPEIDAMWHGWKLALKFRPRDPS